VRLRRTILGGRIAKNNKIGNKGAVTTGPLKKGSHGDRGGGGGFSREGRKKDKGDLSKTTEEKDEASSFLSGGKKGTRISGSEKEISNGRKKFLSTCRGKTWGRGVLILGGGPGDWSMKRGRLAVSTGNGRGLKGKRRSLQPNSKGEGERVYLCERRAKGRRSVNGECSDVQPSRRKRGGAKNHVSMAKRKVRRQDPRWVKKEGPSVNWKEQGRCTEEEEGKGNLKNGL